MSSSTTGFVQFKQECPAVADKPARRETMPKIPPVRGYDKFQSSKKSGVYSN